MQRSTRMHLAHVNIIRMILVSKEMRQKIRTNNVVAKTIMIMRVHHTEKKSAPQDMNKCTYYHIDKDLRATIKSFWLL